MEEKKLSFVKFILKGETGIDPIAPLITQHQAFLEEMEAPPEIILNNLKSDVEFLAKMFDLLEKQELRTERLIMIFCLIGILFSLINIIRILF